MMNFVYPGFLFALFAISIPIIIHLFRFRRFRTVFFPNIAFLEQLSEASDRESRLKHLLVLLARILAIIFLVLAFARPYIPAEGETVSPEGNAVGVYIDNSFSMEALSEQGRLLDEARSRALEIAGMYGAGDRFLLLTNDFEGQHQRFVSRQEFMEMVMQVEVSATVRSIAGVATRKSELFSNKAAVSQRAYYLSDFQKSTTGLDELDRSPVPAAWFIPLEARRSDNVFIDSLWFDSPVHLSGEQVSLSVRIRNDGGQILENQPLRLYLDGRQRSVVAFSLGADESKELTVSWSAGSGPFQHGYVEIADHPVSFDDRLYFSYPVAAEIPLLALKGGGHNPYLQALYGEDELFSYQTMPGFSIDYGRLSEQHLLIMDGFEQVSDGLALELQRFVEGGGSLVIFPGVEAAISSYNRFFQAIGIDRFDQLDTTAVNVSSINELHSLFDGVFEEIPEQMDLPRAFSHYVVSRQMGAGGDVLMQMQNGRPFLTSYNVGEGRVYLSAVPMADSHTNFHRHAIFVPVMLNIALQGGATQPAYHTIGQDQPVSVPGKGSRQGEVFTLHRDGFEVIPEQRRRGNQIHLWFHDQIGEAGNYLLSLNGEEAGGLSFNYDRRESLMDCYSKNELQDKLEDMQTEGVRVVDTGDRPMENVLQEMGMGRSLWRWFIAIALLFLLAEVILIRFWK